MVTNFIIAAIFALAVLALAAYLLPSDEPANRDWDCHYPLDTEERRAHEQETRREA